MMRPLDADFINELKELHLNTFFQIIIIREGSGNYFIGLEQFEIKAPAICFIFPRQICSIQLSEHAQGDAIMFDESIFCSAILSNELKEYNVELYKKINYVDFSNKPTQFDEIEKLKAQIQSLERPLNNIRQIEAKFFTKITILKIIDSVSAHDFSGTQSPDFEDYIRFRRLIEEKHQLNHKVESYAKQLGISAKKLSQLCKKYALSTPLGLIHERITLEIKKRLIFEDTPLKEIAYSLGFDSQSALNKYIASKFDCSPSQLKESLRAENAIVSGHAKPKN